MNLPKLIFRNSWLYDGALMRKKKYERPNDAVFEKFIQNLQKEWVRYGRRILQEISRTTKLKWHEKEIVVYISYGVISYSDPLTLNLKRDIDTLTHELIHRILSEPENWNMIKKGWVRLMKKYKNENQKTKTHIVIHAIHGLLLRKLFGENRLKREKAKVKDERYLRAWEIADRDGYEGVIEKLIKN